MKHNPGEKQPVTLSAAERKRERRNNVLMVAAAGSIGLGLLDVIYPVASAMGPENIVQHMTGSVDSDEKRIQTALEKTFGGHYWVNCTTSYDNQSRLSQQKQSRAMSSGDTPIRLMAIKQADCNRIVDFVDDPFHYKEGAPNAADFGVDLNNYGLTQKEFEDLLAQSGVRNPGLTSSMRLLAHESGHSRGIESESDAECFSYQAMATIMIDGFGVPRKQVIEVAKTAAQNNNSASMPQQYQLQPNCTPSGLNFGFKDAQFPDLPK